MSKRPADSAEAGASAEGGGDEKKRLKYTEEDLERLVQKRLDEQAVVHPLMQETFRVQDPVNGLMNLPGITKRIVDNKLFQRMRHIRQLAMVQYVYPGATHNRLFHSIGTGWLAYNFMKDLRHRQPELKITHREVLCVTIAGLCHDLGHPCYSHMFEVFMQDIGKKRRKAIREQGLTPSPEEEREISQYEKWNHETASGLLLDKLMEELSDVMTQVGLKSDDEGDDFTLIRELIDPPKKELEAALEKGTLKKEWIIIMKGRPVEKSFIYEIVSNWRSGIDVDKFDYFRRDAFHLGIKRQFDHERYIASARVVEPNNDVRTIATPAKDKDTLSNNMLELRKMLHMMAYQHKTVKKLETHMVDILNMLDDHVRLAGRNGQKMKMSEAALKCDEVAYPKLTDTFVESLLLTGGDLFPDSGGALAPAAEEFMKRMTNRNLMRLVAVWDMPRVGEPDMPKQLMPMPDSDTLIKQVHQRYEQTGGALHPSVDLRPVPLSELKCRLSSLHSGMGATDPITRVHLYQKEGDVKQLQLADGDAEPLRRRVFVFWNPTEQADRITLNRLTRAFQEWMFKETEDFEQIQKASSPARRNSSPMRPPSRTPSKVNSGEASSSVAAASGQAQESAAISRRRNLLRNVQASCPLDRDPDPLLRR